MRNIGIVLWYTLLFVVSLCDDPYIFLHFSCSTVHYMHCQSQVSSFRWVGEINGIGDDLPLSLSLSLTCTHTPFKQEIGCFLFTRKWLLWTWHIWKSIHLITSHYCADPPLVLPTLVDLIYSTQESVQISASTTLVALLVNHKQKPEVLCLLLDCLRYFDKWSFSFFIIYLVIWDLRNFRSPGSFVT